VARDRELKEAQSRVEELEKNVADLQKLLEIRNQQVAELEKRAAQPMAVPAAQPSAEAPKPAAESPKPAAETPKPAAEAPPKPKPSPVKPAAKPRPVPPAPAPSFVDEYLGDPLMIGGIGAVILLLIGYGTYAWKKKKRSAQSQLGDSLLSVAAGGATDAEAAGAAVDGEPVPRTEAEEVDPLAEADVYMAYGRDAQAEEILREALQKDAGRPAVHSKLLEIYAKRRDAKRFEEGALKLKALVNGEGPEWDKTMALGRAVDPGNRLYGEGAAAPAGPEISAPEAPALDFDIAATASGMHRASPDVTLDFDLGGTTTEAPVAKAEAPAAARPDTTAERLDFDLGTTTERSYVAEEPAAARDTTGRLDFELSLDAGEAPAEPESAEGADLSTISLDLDGGEAPGAAGGGDAKWQEVATKLDLAKAYEEMGDKDGARELLAEVVKEGDSAQQAQAQQLLAGLS
jgi:pilus assembly protein FimV